MQSEKKAEPAEKVEPAETKVEQSAVAAVSEVEEKSNKPDVSAQTESAEVVEEQVPVNKADQVSKKTAMSKKPNVTASNDTTPHAVVEQSAVEPTQEAGAVQPTSTKEVTGAVTESVDTAKSSAESQHVAAQEFGVVEEMKIEDSKIAQPPLKRLVSTGSMELEESAVTTETETRQAPSAQTQRDAAT